MKIDKMEWFQIAFRYKGSVIPSILFRVFCCGLFGFLISLIYHYYKFPLAAKSLESVVPSIVLGLLLVFRTNTAYERFWEGRKCWGTLVNTVRNLARQIWVSVEEYEPDDRTKKIAALRLLVAFSVATKLHLRGQAVNSELEDLMSEDQYFKLKTMNNPPLEVAFWLGDYLQTQYQRDRLPMYQLTAINNLVNIMVDMLGACERILKTPIPLAYAIHLKQLLLIYCLLLPFQMVNHLGWATGPIVGLISFTLFGIEEIGVEIENPFGHDPNDLPLDTICATMRRNIEDLILLSPTIDSNVNYSKQIDGKQKI